MSKEEKEGKAESEHFELFPSQRTLIYRGLKFVEADLSKFRQGAEARGMKHSMVDIDEQLQALRGGPGAVVGLLRQFAPQRDIFDAGKLDGEGAPNAGGQLSLEAQAEEARLWDDAIVPFPRPVAGFDHITMPNGDCMPINQVHEKFGTIELGYDDEKKGFIVAAIKTEGAAASQKKTIWFDHGVNQWRDMMKLFDYEDAQMDSSQAKLTEPKLRKTREKKDDAVAGAIGDPASIPEPAVTEAGDGTTRFTPVVSDGRAAKAMERTRAIRKSTAKATGESKIRIGSGKGAGKKGAKKK